MYIRDSGHLRLDTIMNYTVSRDADLLGYALDWGRSVHVV